MESREKKFEYLLQFIAIGVIWLWLVYGVLDVAWDVVEGLVHTYNTP